jgi:hypothetical protein
MLFIAAHRQRPHPDARFLERPREFGGSRIPNGCWQSLEYFGLTRSLFSSNYFKFTPINSRSLVSIFSTWRLSAFW